MADGSATSTSCPTDERQIFKGSYGKVRETERKTWSWNVAKIENGIVADRTSPSLRDVQSRPTKRRERKLREEIYGQWLPKPAVPPAPAPIGQDIQLQ